MDLCCRYQQKLNVTKSLPSRGLALKVTSSYHVTLFVIVSFNVKWNIFSIFLDNCVLRIDRYVSFMLLVTYENVDCYRPRRSCWKVVFSQACVNKSVHSACWDALPMECMLGYTPPGQTPLRADTPPPSGHCSRWYASYWNAFLFLHVFVTVHTQEGPIQIELLISVPWLIVTDHVICMNYIHLSKCFKLWNSLLNNCKILLFLINLNRM